MSETLQNNLRQIVEWVIAPIIVFFILSYFQRKRKDLGWEVVSRWPMFNNDAKRRGNLELTQNGRTIEDVDFVAIRISNEGRVDIRQGDYNEPISLAVNEDARILSAYISDKKPEGLPVETISFNGAKAHIGKIPMNSGDSLTINMYISGFNGCPSLITHIAGLKEIRELPRKPRRQLYQNYFLIIMSFLMARTLPPWTFETVRLHMNFPYPFLFLLIVLVVFFIVEKSKHRLGGRS